MNSLDKLYECFEHHLLELEIEKESQAEFIYAVVESYISHILEFGHISQQFETEIREDIEFEVEEMLKMKIYGHFNLDQYRKSLRTSKAS